jgi:hypothetical protein
MLRNNVGFSNYDRLECARTIPLRCYDCLDAIRNNICVKYTASSCYVSFKPQQSSLGSDIAKRNRKSIGNTAADCDVTNGQLSNKCFQHRCTMPKELAVSPESLAL